MTKPPYHIARQEHLGDALDALAARELITGWRWDYDVPNRRALYWITEPGQPERRYETKPAEQLALKYTGKHGSTWKPVPHPGGVDQLKTLPISVDHCWRCGFPISTCPHPDALHPTFKEIENRHRRYAGP
jgi:NAD-dependent dihydropyrimidine dehydrogenase PreA subunit